MARPVSAAAARAFVDQLVKAGKILNQAQRQGAINIISNATGLSQGQRSSLINDILNITGIPNQKPNPGNNPITAPGTPVPPPGTPAAPPAPGAPGTGTPAAPGAPGGSTTDPSSGGTIDTYHQPPFDPRMTTHVNPFPPADGSNSGPQSYSRGFMIWDTTQGSPGGNYKKDDPAYVNFLFNPSTISTSYQMADGSAQAALNYSNTQGGATLNGGDNGLLIPIQQQTSFTIMFDRTYEMNDRTALANIKGLAQFGVDVDIAALRQYTGMYADVYQSNAGYFAFSNSNVSQSSTGTPKDNKVGAQINSKLSFGPLGDLSQGIMQMTIGYLRFGGIGSVFNNGEGQVNPGNFTTWGITYYGYIDSWSVEYTHFTQHMVPIRAVCDISFTFLPPPTAAADPASATNISKALADIAAGLVPPTTNPGPATTTNPPAGQAGR